MPTATSTDGITLHYDAQGRGHPALVFVHGWCCNRHHWDQQLASFAPQYQTVAVDLAGHGDSGGDRAAWTMPAFGGDVAAVVDGLGLEQVVLVGHSMGGLVIVEAARLLGDRVLGLVGVDYFNNIAATRTPEEIAARLAPFHADFVPAAEEFVRDMFTDRADPALRERIVAGMIASPPEIAVEALGEIMAHMPQVREGLRALVIPKHTINSDWDETDLAAAAAHGLQVHMMPDVGHFCMLEDPATFNMMLREILKDLIYKDYRQNRNRP